MKAQTLNKLTAKLKTLTTETLKEMIGILMNDKREEGAVVLDSVLGELETRISETEFIAICDAA